MSRRQQRLTPQQVAAIVAVAVASQQRLDAPSSRMSAWQLRGRGYQHWSAQPQTWAERSLRNQLTER